MSSSPASRFLLRLKPELYRSLTSRAESEGVSINSLCNSILAEGVDEDSRRRWWKEPAGDVVETLTRHFGRDLVGVALFGSRVDGTATEGSDLDMLIVLREGFAISRSLYSWWDRNIEWHERTELSPQFVSMPADVRNIGGLWLEIALVGEVLWERGRRLTTMLGETRRLIEQDAVRRYWSNGQPYWVWRKDEEQGSGT